MKEQLTALDLYYLVKEFKILIGARVQKIYQPTKKSLFIEFHIVNKGKINLVIDEKLAYLSEYKPKMPEPEAFCRLLRKFLTNSIVKNIFQQGSQRIMVIEFSVLKEQKTKKMKLICEFFDKGNIIFCDEDNTIISPIQVQHLKTREIRAKQKYEFPKAVDSFNFGKNSFKEAIKSSSEIIGKTLAKDMNLGKIYSDELIFNSGLKKDILCKELKNNEIDLLFSEFQKLLNKKIEPNVTENEILPIKLNHLSSSLKLDFQSFSQAIESTFILKKENVEQEKNPEIERLKKAINMQEEQIKNLEKEAEENQKIGELIYKKYKLIEEILNTINKAREKYSWKEIKDKVKGHKIIKSINEKNGEIEIELPAD